MKVLTFQYYPIKSVNKYPEYNCKLISKSLDGDIWKELIKEEPFQKDALQ